MIGGSVKLVPTQHLFGIRSLRRTMRDAEVNVAYRWFLGYTMPAKQKKATESTTNPESGAFHKGEHRKCLAYEAHIKVLRYATTKREGYKEYKSKGYICRDCPDLQNCTQNPQHTKTVPRHIWQEYLERAEDIRHSPIGRATYALRSQTIERVFADAKEKHAMRYTPYRGLAAVTT